MQFARDLFDRHAEEIYHYILAWTGEQASAVDLTTMVLRTAAARMDRLVDGAELEMQLIALVRAAVTRWSARGPAGRPTPAAVPEESLPLFDGLNQLDDNHREVLILCELLAQGPERAGRLLGSDRSAVEKLRDEASEALWRAMNGVPEEQPVSTWERLSVGTTLRQAAARWLSPADETVLPYISEQLFGDAPVGVPVKVPARGAAAVKAAAQARLTAGTAAAGSEAPAPNGERAPAEAAAGQPRAPDKLAAPAAPADAPLPEIEVVEHPRRRWSWLPDRVLVLALPPRERWAAWGIAALAAAGLGVVAALTIGGPVSGSSKCGAGSPCPAPSTLAGNAGEVTPAPTSSAGMLGPMLGFPLVTASSSSTTTGPGGRLPTTTRPGPGTTAKPAGTTGPTTSTPTTAGPTTSTPTTAGPTTSTPTTAGPTTSTPTTAAAGQNPRRLS